MQFSFDLLKKEVVLAKKELSTLEHQKAKTLRRVWLDLDIADSLVAIPRAEIGQTWVRDSPPKK